MLLANLFHPTPYFGYAFRPIAVSPSFAPDLNKLYKIEILLQDTIAAIDMEIKS
jgi:hypothetical protein